MRKTFLVLALFALVCVPVMAQRTTGSIRGTVVDSQSETLAGATVTAVNVETGFSRVVTTTAAGTYSIAELPIGTYVVTVESEGFKTAVVQNVVLNVGAQRQVDATLEIGAVTEAVTVTSSAVVVETIGGEVAGLITGEQVRELPLNGRNFIQLTQLMPGVTALDNWSSQNKGLLGGSDLSVSGSRATGNLWLVDGAANNDVGSNRTILVYPSLEAVEEFKVHRNSYGAEFGGAGGAQVNLVTRGGTNNLRGSVFYFGRRGSWNSKNYILEVSDAEAGDLTRDDYGFTLGGAFIKDKVHFFASTEWNDEVRGSAQTTFVPTDLERQGNFSQSDPACSPIPNDPLTGQPFPGNVIPADRLSEAGQNLISLYPRANGLGTGCNNWTDSLNVPINWNQINARLDWNITDRARFMIRYTEDDWTNDDPTAGDANGLWGDDPFPAVGSAWAQPSESLVAQLNNVIGSSALNTFTFSMSGNEIVVGQAGDAGLQQSIRDTNPPTFPAEDKLAYPNTAHPLFWGSGGLAGIWQQGPWANDMDLVVIKDDYEQVFGKHVLKAGILYGDAHKLEPPRSSSDEMQRYWGSAGIEGWGGGSGNIIADFLLEDMAFGFSETSTNQGGDVEWTDLELYVADSWKIRDNMTFDFGVRYTRFDWAENVDSNTYLNFNPSRFNPELGATACNGLMQVPGSDPCGDAGISGASPGPNAALINNNDNFAPRLGFAWDVFRNGKSVLRAGFGQFFQRERVSPNLSLLGNPPAVQNTGGIRTLPGDFVSLDFVSTGNPTNGFDVNADSPYMYQYNLTWEQRVGRDSTVEISYVGSQGRDLLRSNDINQIPLQQDVDNNGVNDRVDYVRCPGGGGGAACRSGFLPYGIYGDASISYWTTDGTSDYDSLQTQFITRFGRGSQFQASYTLADFTANTAMSDSSGGFNDIGTVTDQYQDLDGGDADMRRRHVLNGSVIYNLPTFAGEGGVKEWLGGNWAIGGILIYASGQPITVINSFAGGDLDLHPGSAGAYRSNLRPLASGASCSGSGDLGVLNPAAYTYNGYVLGNTGQQMERSSCDGPDFFQTDLSFYKNFPFRDRFNVQLRFEFFNIFNTNNLIANSVNRTFETALTLDAPRDQATVVTDTGAPPSNFGQASQARDARQFQIGVKFSF